MSHTSEITLSKHKLENNIQYLKSHLASNCRYSAVIKGNAYGHGIEDMLPLMESCGIHHFSTFSLKEAHRAYQVKQKQSEVMIMGYIDHDDLKWVIEKQISFYVFNKKRLEHSIQLAKELEIPAKIHLQVETGMNRLGFSQEEQKEIIRILKNNKRHLELEGICSHLAGAESIQNLPRVQAQINLFKSIINTFSKEKIFPKYRHLACSAAVLNYPEAHFDLVRIGIANYGYWPSNELKMNKLFSNNTEDPLQAVLGWKSKVMSIKTVPEGEYINYGQSFLTNRPTKIASIPVGYAYGFSRDLSNLGRVLIKGSRVPVVGVVNMNMLLVDVTEIKHIKEEDEVVLIGKQKELEISVSSFSDMSTSMNYELLS